MTQEVDRHSEKEDNHVEVRSAPIQGSFFLGIVNFCKVHPLPKCLLPTQLKIV